MSSPKAPNPHRGEAELDLSGTKLQLKATFDTMARAETELGAGIFPILASFLNPREINVSRLAAIVEIFAVDCKLKRAKIGQLILKTGVVDVAIKVGKFLTLSLISEEDANSDEEEKETGEPGNGGTPVV